MNSNTPIVPCRRRLLGGFVLAAALSVGPVAFGLPLAPASGARAPTPVTPVTPKVVRPPDTTPQGTITIVSPKWNSYKNGVALHGTWYGGAIYPVEWQSVDTASKEVDVTLEGPAPIPVAKMNASGKFNFRLPASVSDGEYELVVANTRDPRVEARQKVRLQSARISLEVGNLPGGSVESCSQEQVAWTSTGNAGPVTVTLSLVGPGSVPQVVSTLATNAAGTFEWVTSPKGVDKTPVWAGRTEWVTATVRSDAIYWLQARSETTGIASNRVERVVKPLRLSLEDIDLRYPESNSPQHVVIGWRANACLGSHSLRVQVLEASGALLAMAPPVPISSGKVTLDLPGSSCGNYLVKATDLTDSSITATARLTHSGRLSGVGPLSTATQQRKPDFCRD